MKLCVILLGFERKCVNRSNIRHVHVEREGILYATQLNGNLQLPNFRLRRQEIRRGGGLGQNRNRNLISYL